MLKMIWSKFRLQNGSCDHRKRTNPLEISDDITFSINFDLGLSRINGKHTSFKPRTIGFLNVWRNDKNLHRSPTHLDAFMIPYLDDIPSVVGAEHLAAGYTNVAQGMPDLRYAVQKRKKGLLDTL